MQRTSLYEKHQEAGATLVPFAGWEMPVSYSGTVAEVAATRTSAGLFDVSHMGEVIANGPGAATFVQRVTSNDVSRLASGQAQYSLLLNEMGGVVDDIIVYCQADDQFLIVVNAGCKEGDWLWLQTLAETTSEVVLEDISDRTALIAVQGPQAMPMVREWLGVPEMLRFEFVTVDWQGQTLTLSRTGYTGEDGYEIFCGWEQAPALWDALRAKGAVPCGLGARDVLRLEAAYPLYGHELDAETNALECGVGWAIKADKGQFVGQEAIHQAKAHGVPRRLVGLRMTERAIPREGCPVEDDRGAVIGRVTSGTYSPTLGAGIALARLSLEHAHPGTGVQVQIRGRRAPASVVPLPFFRNLLK